MFFININTHFSSQNELSQIIDWKTRWPLLEVFEQPWSSVKKWNLSPGCLPKTINLKILIWSWMLPLKKKKKTGSDCRLIMVTKALENLGIIKKKLDFNYILQLMEIWNVKMGDSLLPFCVMHSVIHSSTHRFCLFCGAKFTLS